jgi:hypothetical protein
VHPRWSAHWVGPSSHSYSGPYSPDLPRICSPPTMGGSWHVAVPTLDRQAVFDGARCLRTCNVLVLGTSPGWAGFSGRRDSKARPLLCTSFSDFQRRPDRIWLTLHPFAWHHYRDRVRCFFRLSFQRGRVHSCATRSRSRQVSLLNPTRVSTGQSSPRRRTRSTLSSSPRPSVPTRILSCQGNAALRRIPVSVSPNLLHSNPVEDAVKRQRWVSAAPALLEACG